MGKIKNPALQPLEKVLMANTSWDEQTKVAILKELLDRVDALECWRKS